MFDLFIGLYVGKLKMANKIDQESWKKVYHMNIYTLQ